MTTLAWDGDVLATDSKGTMGGSSNIGGFNKIYTPEEGEYWDVQGVRVLAFGAAGVMDNVPFIKEALCKGVTHRTDVNWFSLDFLVLLIDENKQAWYWGQARTEKSDVITLVPITGAIAAGSGGKFATAVMSIGGGAVKAVKTAIRLDNGSGGEVNTWVHPGVPAEPSVRPKVELPPELPKTLEEFNLAIKVEVAKEIAKAINGITVKEVTVDVGAQANSILDKAEKALKDAENLLDDVNKHTKKLAK